MDAIDIAPTIGSVRKMARPPGGNRTASGSTAPLAPPELLMRRGYHSASSSPLPGWRGQEVEHMNSVWRRPEVLAAVAILVKAAIDAFVVLSKEQK